jgi:phage terminase large subunit-like protein
MLIQDLNHVEIISEETHLEGGLALGFVSTGASAYGGRYAQTNSLGGTLASSKKGFFYRSDLAIAAGASSAVAVGPWASAGSGVEALAIAG